LRQQRRVSLSSAPVSHAQSRRRSVTGPMRSFVDDDW
jgi:hypothetical protein